MDRYQRDMKAALDGDEQRVLAERREEIERLAKSGRASRNKFRQRCIVQEIARLKAEYEAIDRHF